MAFSKHFTPDNAPTVTEDPALDQLDEVSPGFAAFMREFSGVSFNNGLYRAHLISDIGQRTALCVEAFPPLENAVVCFSSDWMGRQFAVDYTRPEGQKAILLCDSGTADVFEIPYTFMEFHDSALIDDEETLLSSASYREWLDAGGRPPGLQECIGYKVPLFLNGEDALENLEVTDMEVYWSINAQIIARIQGRSE